MNVKARLCVSLRSYGVRGKRPRWTWEMDFAEHFVGTAKHYATKASAKRAAYMIAKQLSLTITNCVEDRSERLKR